MKLLEATYWAAVNDIEDNIAHLAEHCILGQIANRATKANLPFFDCYATTTPSAIILDLSAYNNQTAELIDSILGSLQPCSKNGIVDEISRIEIEDNIAMVDDCDIDKIYSAVNEVITKLKFEPWTKESNPELDTDNKPVNSLLRYGLSTVKWLLTIKTPVNSDETKVIVDYLASLYLRKPYIYVVDNNATKDGFTYKFKTKADCTIATLQNDLDKLRLISQSDNFINLIRKNNLSNSLDKVDWSKLELSIDQID